jgi:hypothetical protein
MPHLGARAGINHAHRCRSLLPLPLLLLLLL